MIFDERKICKRALEIYRLLKRKAPPDARYVNVFIRSHDGRVIALRDGHPGVEDMRLTEFWVGRFGMNITVMAIQNALEHAMREYEAKLLAAALPPARTEHKPNTKPNTLRGAR